MGGQVRAVAPLNMLVIAKRFRCGEFQGIINALQEGPHGVGSIHHDHQHG